MAYQDASAAHDGPWTEREEALLASSAPQAQGARISALQALYEAYRPMSLAGYTRGDQLRFEALDREVKRRDGLFAALREILPTYTRGSGAFMPLRDQGRAMGPVADSASERRLRRMRDDLPALRAEYEMVMEASKTCNLTRETRTRVFNHLHALRNMIRVCDTGRPF